MANRVVVVPANKDACSVIFVDVVNDFEERILSRLPISRQSGLTVTRTKRFLVLSFVVLPLVQEAPLYDAGSLANVFDSGLKDYTKFETMLLLQWGPSLLR